jgi:hypothetical protein
MTCIFKNILPEGKMRTREIGLIIRKLGKERFPITIKIQYFNFYVNIDSIIIIILILLSL